MRQKKELRVALRTHRYHGTRRTVSDRGVGNQITENLRQTAENYAPKTKTEKVGNYISVREWRGITRDINIQEMEVEVPALPRQMTTESLIMSMAEDNMITMYNLWNQPSAALERASPKTRYLLQLSLFEVNILRLVDLDNSKA